MYKHMIIPTDGSDVGTRAVERGLDLARAIGAKVTILTVLQPFGTFSAATHAVTDGIFTVATRAVTDIADARELQNDAHLRADDHLEHKVRASGVACMHIQAAHHHLNEAVRLTAEAQGCDLVVMPAHERYGLLGPTLDSETVKLLSRSSLPVLVLH